MMMDRPSAGGFPTSPWAAVLGHHTMGPVSDHPGFSSAHHSMPMDLQIHNIHNPQGFSYYRYRDDTFCWSDRKPSLDEVGNASSVNSRILELRKEKSRDAARSRRGKENYEFYELAKMLPLPAAITSQLDKASIIRLTISYLKLRDFSSHGDPPWTRENSSSNKVLKGASRRTSAGLALEMFEQHQGTHILQSLDGFALAVAADGRFLYISETVSIYLGLSQVEMTGSSIFDYVHLNDHAEIAEQLGLSLTGQSGISSPGSGTSDDGTLHGTNNPDVSSQMSLNSSTPFKGFDRSFCVRMKSTLTKRGCHFKSSGYRVVLMICRLRPQYTFSHNRKAQPPLLGMVALAIALPPPSVHEIRLESDMFVTRINFDFQIAHCEPKVTDLLDYTAEELTGKNLYSLCHGEDANKLRKCHMDLINKGQVLTHYYRIMNKNGGYTWIQTCATVICSSKNADEQNIICVNYVISAKEYSNLVLDCCQQEKVKLESSETIRDESGAKSPDDDPTNDKGLKSSNLSTRNLASPKSETSDQNATKINANLNSRTGNNVQNTNIVNETSPLTVKDGSSTRGRKRKLKPENNPDNIKNDAKIQIKTNLIAEKQIHKSPDQSESSVKELENVMSKHLPSPTTSITTTDFSTDTLLKQQEHQQEKSSTIQWIGHNSHLPQGTMPAIETMPASSLLRQLYANRESVIRATSRPVGASGIYTDAIQGGSLLPTPPGSETSSYDSQFLLQKPPDAFSSLVSAYGTYTSTVDYHNAMTPPSSVSPRDNSINNNNSIKPSITLQTTTSLFEYSSDAIRGQYGPESGSMHQLPLKPQPYSAAVMHHNPIEAAYSSLDQAQFFPHHSGFHLYKNSTSAGWGV